MQFKPRVNNSRSKLERKKVEVKGVDWAAHRLGALLCNSYEEQIRKGQGQESKKWKLKAYLCIAAVYISASPVQETNEMGQMLIVSTKLNKKELRPERKAVTTTLLKKKKLYECIRHRTQTITTLLKKRGKNIYTISNFCV